MTVHDYSAKTTDGEERKLSDYKGKVMVIVNTASKCGFTPHQGHREDLVSVVEASQQRHSRSLRDG